MDHAEALVRLKKLRAEARQHAKEFIEGRPEVPPEAMQRQQELQGQYMAFGARLNADPELMDLVLMWNVGVRADQAVDPNIIDRLPAAEDRRAAVREAMLRLGGIPRAVIQAIEASHYTVHGLEIATGGWRISTRCTEASSRRLCALLHRKFRSAIGNDMIFVERWFADYTLIGLQP